MKRASVKMGYKGINTAIIVSVVLLAAVLNLVLFGLVEGYRLYLYADVKYEHQLSSGAEAFLGDLREQGKTVRIYFCMPESSLKADPVYALVWHTACQMRDRFDFVEVDNINLFTEPEDASKYLYREQVNPETGVTEQVRTANLTRQSVIIDGGSNHIVQSLSSFFVLDEKERITAYRGEEVMTAGVRYVLAESHPKAYYTVSHGETVSLPMLNLLVCAGYEVAPIDLLKDTPTDTTGLLLIAAPAYDFVKGTEGVRGEIEKLDTYMQKGGLVLACLDPLSANTTALEALFSRWGVEVTHQTVRDAELSVTTDGYTLVTAFAETEEAKRLADVATAYSNARVILREASALTTEPREGKRVSPLLLSSPFSKTYYQDKMTSDKGEFPLSAIALDNTSGGGVLVTASYYLGASDALNSNEYGNSRYLYAVMSHYGNRPVPISAEKLHIDNRRLEDLTMGEARRYALLLTVVIPLAVAGIGGAVLLRRKNGRRAGI